MKFSQLNLKFTESFNKETKSKLESSIASSMFETGGNVKVYQYVIDSFANEISEKDYIDSIKQQLKNNSQKFFSQFE